MGIWELFDKIIQLPFMMPMGSMILVIMSSLLVDVGLEKDSVDTEDIKEIVLLTIGKYRSIKD